eukprot:9545-Heterococcus_DN1.PRE.5
MIRGAVFSFCRVHLLSKLLQVLAVQQQRLDASVCDALVMTAQNHICTITSSKIRRFVASASAVPKSRAH